MSKLFWGGALAMLFAVAACDDDTTASADAASTSDLCAEQTVSPVDVTETQMTTPYPEPAGGELVDGVYHLTRFEIYPDATADGTVRRRLLKIENGTVTAVNQDGTEPVQVIGGTISASGTTLTMGLSCPQTAQVNMPYTASGNELWFHAPDEPNVQVYTRQ